MVGNPEVLDPKAAASAMGLTVQTLARWRHEKKGPRYLKLGGAVRYTRAAIDTFLRESERTSTADHRTSTSGRAA